MTTDFRSGVDDRTARPSGEHDGPDAELRALAVGIDAQSVGASGGLDFWAALREGRLRVHDSFSADTRSYLVLRGAAAPPVPSRQWEVLNRIVSGDSQKVIAIDLRLSASSIATLSRAALRAIGVTARVSSVPPLLSMLANHSAGRRAAAFRQTELELRGIRYYTFSFGLNNPVLTERLSPAEQTVAMMRIEGRSLVDIARSRRTSPRTVANQMATAFRRLGISGRSSLVQYFLRP